MMIHHPKRTVLTEDSEFEKPRININTNVQCAINNPEERNMRGECLRCGALQGYPCRDHPEMV